MMTCHSSETTQAERANALLLLAALSRLQHPALDELMTPHDLLAISEVVKED